MPTFQYEAMDHTGKEVKDTIDAATQEEAQQLIRQKGFFVTKITERSRTAKKKAAAKKRKVGCKKKSITIGKISNKQLVTFSEQTIAELDPVLNRPVLRFAAAPGMKRDRRARPQIANSRAIVFAGKNVRG